MGNDIPEILKAAKPQQEQPKVVLVWDGQKILVTANVPWSKAVDMVVDALPTIRLQEIQERNKALVKPSLGDIECVGKPS